MFSEKNKWIGVGINKTATTSMASIINNNFPESQSGKHDTLSFSKNKIKGNLNNYFKFSMIRNPFDRVVSLYEYRRSRIKRKLKRGFKPIAFPLDIETGKEISFKEGVKRIYSELSMNKKQKKGLGPQINGLIVDNEIKIDYLGYFDDIESYGKAVCENLKVNYTKLPFKNKSKNKNFKLYYDDETYEIVKEVYKKDIELIEEMGYKAG